MSKDIWKQLNFTPEEQERLLQAAGFPSEFPSKAGAASLVAEAVEISPPPSTREDLFDRVYAFRAARRACNDYRQALLQELEAVCRALQLVDVQRAFVTRLSDRRMGDKPWDLLRHRLMGAPFFAVNAEGSGNGKPGTESVMGGAASGSRLEEEEQELEGEEREREQEDYDEDEEEEEGEGEGPAGGVVKSVRWLPRWEEAPCPPVPGGLKLDLRIRPWLRHEREAMAAGIRAQAQAFRLRQQQREQEGEGEDVKLSLPEQAEPRPALVRGYAAPRPGVSLSEEQLEDFRREWKERVGRARRPEAANGEERGRKRKAPLVTAREDRWRPFEHESMFQEWLDEDLLLRPSLIDWKAVADKHVPSRTPLECELQWRNVDDPRINYGEWTEAEKARLKELLKRLPRHDWTAIAAALGTRRTPLQVVQFHQRELIPPMGNWSAEEDAQLNALVRKYGEHSWSDVASGLRRRKPDQAWIRWTKSAAPHLKKGRFTKYESEVLRLAVLAYGENWKQVAAHLEGRTDPACNTRWRNVLAEGVKKGQWTREEDSLLYSLFEQHGANWALIAAQLPGRTRHQVKQRFVAVFPKAAQTHYTKVKQQKKAQTVKKRQRASAKAKAKAKSN